METTERSTRDQFFGGVPFLVRFLTLALLIGDYLREAHDCEDISKGLLLQRAGQELIGGTISHGRNRTAPQELTGGGAMLGESPRRTQENIGPTGR